jgi:hypothetical protein
MDVAMESFVREHPVEAALWHAVLSSNVAEVRARLKKRADVNLVHPASSSTVLSAAAEAYMCEATATGDCTGQKPKRSGGKAFQVLELLLRHGADPNVGFVNPSSGNMLFPMTVICGLGLVEGVRLFIEASPLLDVMAPGSHKRGPGRGVLWPLVQAISKGRDEVALLLFHHPSFDVARDSRVLCVAAEADNVNILSVLLAMPGAASVINLPYFHSHNPTTALCTACWSGHSCVQPLLEAGADALLSRDGKRSTMPEPDHPMYNLSPMACAISSGADPHVIDLLVAAGARRPVIEKRGGGRVVFIGRDGEEADVINVRTLRSGPGIVTSSAPSLAGRASSSGLVDSRFDKYACAACAKLPEFGVALLRCARCKKTAYCDAACQKAHWREHKKTCAAAPH